MQGNIFACFKIVPEFSWMNWSETRKSSVIMVDIQTDIRKTDLSNTKQKILIAKSWYLVKSVIVNQYIYIDIQLFYQNSLSVSESRTEPVNLRTT
jgi:hypothetical protein